MASGSRSIYKGSDETYLHECDVCKYNNKTSEATSFCTVCTEYLCMTCDQSHRGSRATRDHKIVTGRNMPSLPVGSKPHTVYCEHHKTMTLNVYCVSHDDVICGTCKLTDHKKCKTTDVKQQKTAIKMREAFDETMRQMVDLQNNYHSFKDSREQDINNLKLQKKTCLDDLQHYIRDIKNTLDKIEKNLTKEASDIEQSMIKEIENHVTIADDALIQINDRIKSFEDCRKSQDNDTMFVCMKKANTLKHKYEDVLYTMQDEIRPTQIHFKANDVMTDVLLQLQSLGTIEIQKDPSYNRLLNVTVGERREIDVGCGRVYDCTFIGDSHLVLTCIDNGLKLLDKHFKVQSQLPDFSARVATINENEVIVTQGYINQLQRVSIFPNMAVTKTLKMDRLCAGVDVFNNEIYVTCHDNPGNGEVRVLNMDGTLQRQLGVNDGQYMFSGPTCIKVSRDGCKVFISDWYTNKVTCLSQQGDVLYEYVDRELKTPTGMHVDDEGTVLVCGEDSHNIHMIKHDGSKQKILLSEKDGMKDPLCISYRPRDGCLVVGLYHKDKPLLIFTL